MNILKLIAVQKAVFVLGLFCLVVSLMASSCGGGSIVPSCNRVEPTLEGEFIECTSCQISEEVDTVANRLNVKVIMGETVKNLSSSYLSDSYDDVTERFINTTKEDVPVELSIIGGSEDMQNLKLSVTGFNIVNDIAVPDATSTKELPVPDAKDYCQISFRYEVNTENYDEILYEIEADNGRDETIRMKIRMRLES